MISPSPNPGSFVIQMELKPRKIGLSAAQIPNPARRWRVRSSSTRTEHTPQGQPTPHRASQVAPKGKAPLAGCVDPAGVPQLRQISSGCREVRDAASASRLAIAYSGCQPPCFSRHGTKEHPPCAQTPHGVPWLVFLPRRKTAAPSCCAQEPLRVLLSHEGVRQGVGVSKKVQHAHSPGPGGPVPP